MAMNVNSIPFPFSVLLGRAELTLKAFYDLDEGDILLLDQKVGSSVPVIVGKKEYLLGAPCFGVQKEKQPHKAVKIEGFI